MTEERSNKRLLMLEKMIEKGSNDPFVFYARALELRGLGQLAQALSALADVEERYPDYVPTFLMAGQVAQSLDLDEVARGYLERGLELAARVGDEHARSELQQALAALPG